MQDDSRLGQFKRGKTKWLLLGGGILLPLIGAVAGYFVFGRLQDSAATKEVNNVVQKVGKIYDLPQERPTIAQINDKDKIKDQSFFAKAKNGDYLLVFNNEKFALIYRQETNKIINAGPINPDAKASD